MQYLGGKARIAKEISAVMLASTPLRDTYVEPFVGSGWVAERMVPHFASSYLTDLAPDLILMWQRLLDGGDPPTEVSEEEYRALRDAKPSALRGFVGYGCSFGGKFFGGYARGASGRNYARQAHDGLMRKVPKLLGSHVACLDYKKLSIEAGVVVYCDPPYAGTTGYTAAGDFDSSEFWKVMDEWSSRAVVFVSEYSAPAHWGKIWEKGVSVGVSGSGSAIECLFTRA